MEIPKAIFIVFSQTQDSDCKPEHIQAINKFSKWLGPDSSKSILISSPIQECLHLCKYLSEQQKFLFYISEELSTDQSLSYYSTKSNYLNNLLQLDQTQSGPFSIQKLINLVQARDQTPVFVIDKSKYDEFGFDIKGRSEKSLSFYKLESNYAQRSLHGSAVLPPIETCSFRNELRLKIHNQLTDFTLRLVNISKNNQVLIEKIDNSADNLKKIIKEPNLQKENYKRQLEFLDSALDKTNKVLDSIEDTVGSLKQYSNLKVDARDLEGKVAIRKFFFSTQHSTWIIKIKNESEVNAINLRVFCIETEEVIYKFDLIQADSKIKAQAKLGAQDYYGKNLVAFIEDVKVSNVFPVYPFEISLIHVVDDEVLVKVRNDSVSTDWNPSFAISTSRIPVKLSRNLQYGQTSDERLKIEGDYSEVILFLVGKTRQISNIISLKKNLY